MKTQTGIWIDSSKAIIVALQNGKEAVTEIASGIENASHHQQEGDKGTFMGSHHINAERKFNERKNNQTDAFLKSVITEIKQTDEFYLTGPSEMKLHLRAKLNEDKNLAARIKGVESCDHITLNQLVAKVKQFFAHV